MPKLLVVQELADSLRVSKANIYAKVPGREIPLLKLGARVLFDPEDIARWLIERKVAVPPCLSDCATARRPVGAERRKVDSIERGLGQ